MDLIEALKKTMWQFWLHRYCARVIYLRLQEKGKEEEVLAENDFPNISAQGNLFLSPGLKILELEKASENKNPDT